MNQWRYALFAALGLTLVAVGASVAEYRANVAASQPDTLTDTVTPHRRVPGYGNLPIRFEPNVGQAISPVKYVARSNGYDIAITDQGVMLSPWTRPWATHKDRNLRNRKPAVPVERAPLRLSLVNTRATRRLRAEQQQVSVSNYFIGNDRSKWHGNVANYGALRYQQVYPGIDWVIHGSPEQLEYDLVIAPQADPRQVRLDIEGADRISLDENGDLVLKVGDQTMRHLKPVIFQITANGEKRNIDGGFVLDDKQVTFALGDYDHSRELIIDPSFVYSTYLGGSDGNTEVTAIAVDRAGNTYVAGSTEASDFYTVDPIQSSERGSGGDAFVTKFNADGSALVYSTYLGGSISDYATGIALDNAGNVYVAGNTNSSDFPTVNAVQGSMPGDGAAFVAKLNATGDALVYSTYLGGSQASYLLGGLGSGYTTAAGIAVDSAGNAYVAGVTASINFPTVNSFQGYSPNGGSVTSFVTKFNADGSALVYSTYLGGSDFDEAHAIAVDAAGDAYVVGTAFSKDFPTVNPFQGSTKSGFTAFVTKFSADGNTLIYSTYLGGSGIDQGFAVAVDAAGSAYVTGSTESSDFPTVNPLQALLPGGGAGFVTKFNPAGSALVYSTYLSGASPKAIAVDDNGDAYVAGYSTSDDLPIVKPLQDVSNGIAIGASNAFITRFNADGSALAFSTYLGGSGLKVPSSHLNEPPMSLGDSANSIAVDKAGNIYVAGDTVSSNFPIFDAFQIRKAGAIYAGFVSKISQTPPERNISSPPSGGGGAMGWAWISALTGAVAMRCRKCLELRNRMWTLLVP